MKKITIFFIMFFILMAGTKVRAAEIEIQAIVNGKVDKGENIEILININQIPSLYCGAIEFKYDPSMLKVKSIEPGDLITNMPGIGKFEAVKNVEEQKGIAKYEFSCLGKIDGYSGSGAVVKITAEVLKKADFQINSKPFLTQTDIVNNLKLTLYDTNVKAAMGYTFKPYKYNVNSVNSGTASSNNTTGTSTTSDPAASSIAENKPNENPNIPNTSESKGSSSNASNSVGEKNASVNKTTSVSKKGDNNGILYGSIGVLIILAGTGGYLLLGKKHL